MSSRSQPRIFRAEHLGSLIRPASLLEKRAGIASGETSNEELAAAQKAAIKDIVQVQRDAGMKVITDGEFSRALFIDGVFNKLEGSELRKVPMDQCMPYLATVILMKSVSKDGTFPSYICTGKLKRTTPFYVPDFEYLKSIVPPEEHNNLKLTMCAPEWFHVRHGPYAYSKEVYTTDEEYFADIVTAYRAELSDLYAAGCRNIQFDDPQLIEFCSEEVLAGMRAHGMDPERLFQLYIDTYNQILKDRPADLRVGVHTCRGNFAEAKWTMKGHYDRIASKLFNELNVDCYYLEYDTERAGTFEPLKHLPRNKVVVLGMISTKIAALEDLEELKTRVNAAATLISQGVEPRSKEEAMNQICISPQCGFSTRQDSNHFEHDDMVKKLRFVVEAARALWPDDA